MTSLGQELGAPVLSDETAARAQWVEQNQRHLVASLHLVRAHLISASPDEVARAAAQVEAAAAQLRSPAAIDRLTHLFQLSPFERGLLLLCAGVELDEEVATACAAAQGDPRRVQPTFGLALARLPGAHWSAIGPMAPLRRLRLVDLAPGESLTRSALRIDEWALHSLAGAHQLDERLGALLEPGPPPGSLAPSQQAVADRLVALWMHPGAPMLVQLCGDDDAGKRAVAAGAAAALNLRLYVLAGAALAGAVDGLLSRLITREAIVGRSMLLVGDELDELDTAAAAAARRLVEQLVTPAVLTARDRVRLSRPSVVFEVRPPLPLEQRALWREALATARPLAPEIIDALVAPLVQQFNLPAPAIRAACESAVAAAAAGDALPAALWESCRSEARPKMDELAQRMEPTAGWDDLVLPAAQRETLRTIAMHVRRRSTVYGDWGFGRTGARGLGISALFAGVSGTGKTMASEVLSRELRLDLYRIDLSQVVSKYIGETEKNLRRVFDAAEHGAALLLFDEADALFGRRSEVKDSHDRYANIEVGYLLQRMETFRGLAILTTNMKSSLDPAFLRRLRFVVQFPFPGKTERAEIWRRAFPRETPVGDVDIERLSRLNISGGSIRNIALNAAFLACEDCSAVGMSHLVKAVQEEFAKLERPLTQNELG